MIFFSLIKLLNLSVPQFPLLESTFLINLLWEWDVLICIKLLEQCMRHNDNWINVDVICQICSEPRKCESSAAGFSFIDQRGNCSSQLKSRLCRVCTDSWKLSSALQEDGCSSIHDGRTRVISWWSGGGGSVTEPQMVSLCMKTSLLWRGRSGRGDAHRERSTSRRAGLPAQPQRTPLPFSLGGERTGL